MKLCYGRVKLWKMGRLRWAMKRCGRIERHKQLLGRLWWRVGY